MFKGSVQMSQMAFSKRRGRSVHPVLWGLAALALLAGRPIGAAEGEPAGWLQSYDEALAAAQQQGKPLLLHFHASWCGPCRRMEASVLNTAAVRERLGRDVVGVKVDADDRDDLASKYNVHGLPTDVFVSPDGEVISRTVGAASMTSYLARIDAVSRQFVPSTPNADVQLAETTEKNADARAAGESAGFVGLDGFSPVALVKESEWVKGKKDFTAEHEGVTYHFASAAEREQFIQSPATFAPKHLGCDPLVLFERGEAVRGAIQYGAFYEGQVFLMSSSENQERFLKNPTIYARRAYSLKVSDVKHLAMGQGE
jgi:YHS domain-containing protein/thiol-disulfide isomerase/thioredoxin